MPNAVRAAGPRAAVAVADSRLGARGRDVTRVRKLFRFEQASGLLIIAAIFSGLTAANSPLSGLYQAVHHTPIYVGVGPFDITEPLIGWINEGLMVFFFLLVGLEIKREIAEGHLSTPKCAALPAIAALGGMIVPAALYVGLNWGDPLALRGWAIPTATDIVLALGVLSLLGSRVPVALKVFLTALAIFDDVGAVLVIGLFYGEGIALVPLAVALATLAGLALLNVCRVTSAAAYVVLGLVLWVAMLESGVEAALSGVLIALAVPLHVPGGPVSSPLRAAERRLHPWGVLVIVPLFAFFNAGVPVDGAAYQSLSGPVALGVVLGLFVGKQVGVFGAAWLAVRLGLGRLPAGVGWAQMYGVAALAGIGFTMSLFVASLAFAPPDLVAAAKLAILLGSLLSALTGLVVIYLASRAGSAAGSDSREALGAS
jgi:NhaA family Na+:H+ antiporter